MCFPFSSEFAVCCVFLSEEHPKIKKAKIRAAIFFIFVIFVVAKLLMLNPRIKEFLNFRMLIASFLTEFKNH